MLRFILYILALCVVITGVQLIGQLPWWTFTIPCFGIGIWHGRKRLNTMPFLSGFIAGFIVWAGASLFFHRLFGGKALDMLANLINMQSYVAVLLIGITGGLLAGLAVFSGWLLLKKEEKYKLNLSAEEQPKLTL